MRRLPPGAIALAIVLLLVVAVPTPGAAQESEEVSARSDVMSPPDEVMAPPTLERAEVTLAQAVRMTLRSDPRLQEEKQLVAEAVGALQQARGLFDPVVTVIPGYTLEYREIFPTLRRQQRDRRDAFEQLRDGAQAFLADLTPLLADLNSRDLSSLRDFEDLRIPDCPAGFSDLLFDPADFNFNVASDTLQRTEVDPFDSLLGTTIIVGSPLGNDARRLLEICDPTVPGTSGVLGRLEEFLDLSDIELSGSLLEAFDSGKEVLFLAREIGQLLGDKAALALERLGGIPQDEVGHELSVEASFDKPFRNGIDLGFDVTLRSSERNFEGKSPDPAFGGMGFPTRYPNSISVRLNVPLGKGRGAVSRAAPERAAEAIVTARRERLRHTITAETFSTVIAFIGLASAQERLELLEESAERQERLVEATEELVQAGEMVGAERDRAAARAASVRRSVAAARLDVLRSRLVLADAMGLQVESLQDAPMAAEGLPEDVRLDPDLAALADDAATRRRDVRSFESSLAAAEIQAEAAQADLKRTFDLSVRGGMSTLYESPFFKVFEEERDEPVDEPLRFYDPRGIFRSFDANWEPFVTANFTMTFPVANDAAEGRLLQRRSQVTSTEIGLTNLERVIRQNVVDVVRALEHARQALDRREQAVDWLEETLEGDLQRFRFGDRTLIDTLLTEENLTRERLELVGATQTYLSLVARLQFETGRLVRFTAEDTANEQVEFDDARLWGTR